MVNYSKTHAKTLRSNNAKENYECWILNDELLNNTCKESMKIMNEFQMMYLDIARCIHALLPLKVFLMYAIPMLLQCYYYAITMLFLCRYPVVNMP